MSRLNRLGLVLGLGIALTAVACGSDDEGSSGGGSGTAGTSATGGTAGSGGTSATGGTGGTSATGGTGGSAGSAGTGGSAGSAGTGGSAGSAATGGSAGSAATGGSAGSAGTGGSAGSAGTGGAAGSGGGACNATIADLRAEATGADHKAVNLEVCDAVVTYVTGSGYFIQENSATGPGIQVYEGGGWAADVAIGDVVSLRATEITEYNGHQEISAHDPVTVNSQGFDVGTLIQDLTVEPSEAYESELVRVTGATVATLAGNDATLDYGTATGVVLRATDTSMLCEGATFDILAPVTEFAPVHRIQSFDPSDFTNVDISSCSTGSGRTPEPGELLINEFLADPPPDVAGDANCDGTRDSTDDEFVEIVNLTGDVLALDGVTISDNSKVRFTFPLATDLPAHSVMLVFGGGSVSCTFPSNVSVMTVTENAGLSLNNAGDSITLTRDDATELATLTYTGTNDDDASQTLSPDLNDTDASAAGIAGFVLHNTVGTTPFSPGTKIDGSDF